MKIRRMNESKESQHIYLDFVRSEYEEDSDDPDKTEYYEVVIVNDNIRDSDTYLGRAEITTNDNHRYSHVWFKPEYDGRDMFKDKLSFDGDYDDLKRELEKIYIPFKMWESIKTRKSNFPLKEAVRKGIRWSDDPSKREDIEYVNYDDLKKIIRDLGIGSNVDYPEGEILRR